MNATDNDLMNTAESGQISFELYDPSNEKHTGRLIKSIMPVAGVRPETQGMKLQNNAITDAEKNEREIDFLNNGVFSVLRTPSEILEVIHALSLFKFSLEQNYIADMFTGLYTMLTCGEKFLDIEEISAKKLKTGEEKTSAIRIMTTVETLYKATFGSLLSENARSINGAYDITHDAKKVIDPIINGKAPMPRATVTLKNVLKRDGTIGDMWVSGEPIRIHRHATSNLVAVDLDYYFAPVKIENNKIVAGDQYLSSIAGLTAMLQFGKKYNDEGNSPDISSSTARRIFLAIQMAVKIQRISGFGVRKSPSGRINITVRRSELPNIIPRAIRDIGKPTQHPCYKEVSNAVAKTGQYIYKAIEMIGILDQLEALNTPIYIPAIDKGAEFPDDKGEPYKNIVYFKADQLSK
jgi:hypothetical protein